MALAAAGVAMAVAGITYAGVSGVNQTAQVKKEEEQGTYRGRFVDPSHIIVDRSQQSWNVYVPIEAVNNGVWGIPRNYPVQPGKGIVPAYGLPKGNPMTMGR